MSLALLFASFFLNDFLVGSLAIRLYIESNPCSSGRCYNVSPDEKPPIHRGAEAFANAAIDQAAARTLNAPGSAQPPDYSDLTAFAGDLGPSPQRLPIARGASALRGEAPSKRAGRCWQRGRSVNRSLRTWRTSSEFGGYAGNL